MHLKNIIIFYEILLFLYAYPGVNQDNNQTIRKAFIKCFKIIL